MMQTAIYEIEYQKVTPGGALATRRTTIVSVSVDGALARLRARVTIPHVVTAVRRIEAPPGVTKVRVR